MARRPQRGQEFITGLDDSGGHAALFRADGKRIVSEKQPLVGVAAVSVSRPLVDDFEGSWNNLRARIQAELGLASPPPIHVRWMWGSSRPDKHKNPYLNATKEQAAAWLTEAVEILVRFQGYRYEFGVLGEFYQRTNMQDLLEPYYDPAAPWRAERDYLASREIPKDLYKVYHRATVYPLLRTLPHAFWQLDASVKNIGGKSSRIIVDAFTGIEGVGAPEVLRATQELAQLKRVSEMSVVDAYEDSALVQAADVVAWSYNRLVTQDRAGIKDIPFLEVFWPMLRVGRSLGGTPLSRQVKKPAGTSAETLCIVYSLARAAVAEKWPDFVEEMFVHVDEFHRRSQEAYTAGGFSVSVLTDEGQKRAEAYAATKMTGPRSKTAAE